jgi:hypothetical protein
MRYDILTFSEMKSLILVIKKTSIQNCLYTLNVIASDPHNTINMQKSLSIAIILQYSLFRILLRDLSIHIGCICLLKVKYSKKKLAILSLSEWSIQWSDKYYSNRFKFSIKVHFILSYRSGYIFVFPNRLCLFLKKYLKLNWKIWYNKFHTNLKLNLNPCL